MEEQNNIPTLNTPTPESLQTPVQTTPPLKFSRRKTLKVVLLVLLLLIAAVAIGYVAYAKTQTDTLQSTITTKDATIKSLNGKVNSLTSAASTQHITTTTTQTPSTGNVIDLRELGLSITVPDSIKDLSYSYGSAKDGLEYVKFSTKAITDKYNDTGSCSSSASAAPLGELDKFPGQFTGGVGGLLKQYPTYYTSYSTAQAACVDNQENVDAQVNALKGSLSTIKEL